MALIGRRAPRRLALVILGMAIAAQIALASSTGAPPSGAGAAELGSPPPVDAPMVGVRGAALGEPRDVILIVDR